jgi:Rod binding domain-containing protein
MPSVSVAVSPVITGQAEQADVRKAARQVEEVFLNELLKSMFQNTELAKDKVISGYLPVITAEVSKSISGRGIGIQDFLMRSPAFNIMAAKGRDSKSSGVAQSAEMLLKLPAQSMSIKAYETGSE